ncbi:FISUMP domain-containing protein [Fibrobacter succinogenes]|uniref:Major paralogous domain-containing protein n=1 Tax=Fibrobacter succinogenes TaxID=833 RepID=A0A380S8W5_FIBSU|nr:FISUMP domain-containing protein [Fibrobacter succinogenes]PWJ34818.1 uncharacterized protein (TIGR02145 family) [Fibrobacter succinogenes subsp. elongatus]SUQ24941.1 major paralogous domain-containing protein [Fibrobacter succinogenes]
MNYSKFSGLVACKMAMLLAFMFAACSDEPSVSPLAQDGGYTEEQGVYALVGRVGDVYPKLLLAVDENSLQAPKGSSITVYELDSLTFDTTGRSFVSSINDDEGRFVIDSLDFDSPYVLIEEIVPSRDTCLYVSDWLLPLVENQLRYEKLENPSSETQCFERTLKAKEFRAVVDLRKKEKISVNSLTTAKVPLLQKYIAEGKTFAEASQMAERKILEDFGIYEDLGSFEKMFDDDSELSYVNELIQYTDSSAREKLLWEDVVGNYVSPKEYMGNVQLEKYYQNMKKMIDYRIGFLAKVDGLGQCTEARENDVGEIRLFYTQNYVNVVCHSKKWTMGFKSVEHTKGLLVDNRDGRSYETVTYNWGGTTQTWMAEDLVYADSAHPTCQDYIDKSDATCRKLGRYVWLHAMDIGLDDVNMFWIRWQGGDTVSYQDCLKVFSGDLDSVVPGTCMQGSLGGYWDYEYANPVLRSNLNAHQGICPDGWRIPTTSDWRTLLQNLGELYGVDYVKAAPVLYDETATGFGLYSSNEGLVVDSRGRVVVSQNGFFNDEFAVTDEHLSRVQFFGGYSTGYGFGFRTPGDREYEESYFNIPPLDKINIRCIKN